VPEGTYASGRQHAWTPWTWPVPGFDLTMHRSLPARGAAVPRGVGWDRSGRTGGRNPEERARASGRGKPRVPWACVGQSGGGRKQTPCVLYCWRITTVACVRACGVPACVCVPRRNDVVPAAAKTGGGGAESLRPRRPHLSPPPLVQKGYRPACTHGGKRAGGRFSRSKDKERL